MPEDCGNEAEQLFALDVADADNFERVELKAKRRSKSLGGQRRVAKTERRDDRSGVTTD